MSHVRHLSFLDSGEYGQHRGDVRTLKQINWPQNGRRNGQLMCWSHACGMLPASNSAWPDDRLPVDEPPSYLVLMGIIGCTDNTSRKHCPARSRLKTTVQRRWRTMGLPPGGLLTSGVRQPDPVQRLKQRRYSDVTVVEFHSPTTRPDFDTIFSGINPSRAVRYGAWPRPSDLLRPTNDCQPGRGGKVLPAGSINGHKVAIMWRVKSTFALPPHSFLLVQQRRTRPTTAWNTVGSKNVTFL